MLESRGAEIEGLLASEDWTGARRAIRLELRHAPDDHWLVSRMALTYYEQRKYKKALELEGQALRLAPRCPLALWGCAGSLEMLGREAEALVVYRRLIRRGPVRLGRGPCGEGIRWAGGLVADCWYRLGRISEAQGRPRMALHAYQRHLEARRGGGSIYDAAEVRSRHRLLLSRGTDK
jgi:tetratricopeptide (TPR) repeat protein